ncbi:MAG: LytTR family DNA-binding domain-containing protein [Flavobacteriaceae bacterium]|nr:LytTR family DNA-binding domain-containing protein [Flavobacteriaceae bacterium]
MRKTYNVIIVDDEPVAREILESHLSHLDHMSVIKSCQNATEAFSAIHENSIDLIFLDINMPEVDGIMFANAIQGKIDVIFTTAYRDYAVEGFNLNAIDYLLKPISLDRFMKAVQKFVDSKTESSADPPKNFTFFRIDRQMKKVEFSALTHIESYGDYVKLHTTNEVLVTRETLSHVMNKLPKDSFVRVHRSFVVSIGKIHSYTPETITIARIAIPISRSYRDEVMERLRGV